MTYKDYENGAYFSWNYSFNLREICPYHRVPFLTKMSLFWSKKCQKPSKTPKMVEIWPKTPIFAFCWQFLTRFLQLFQKLFKKRTSTHGRSFLKHTNCTQHVQKPPKKGPKRVIFGVFGLFSLFFGPAEPFLKHFVCINVHLVYRKLHGCFSYAKNDVLGILDVIFCTFFVNNFGIFAKMAKKHQKWLKMT